MALQHGQHDHRILDRVQGVPLLRNRDVVAGLAVPGVAARGQAHVTLQHLQRRLARAVVFGQVMAGQQGQHGLAQFVGVTTVDGVRGPSAVRLLRLGQLFGSSAARLVSEMDSINDLLVLRAGSSDQVAVSPPPPTRPP